MTRRLVLTAIATLGLCFYLADLAAANSTSFTWTGAANDANWSTAANWGGTGPPGSASSDTLDFPSDLAGCSGTPTATCYTAQDDLSGYSVAGITLDDGSDDYLLQPDASSDPLTIGSAGLYATTALSEPGGAEIGIPLILGTAQTWTIDGGSSDQGQLLLDEPLSAASTSTDTLTIDLEREGALSLSGDNETGNVTLYGEEWSDSGADAWYNGSVDLSGSDLDSTDDRQVTVTNAGLLGTGAIGALTAYGAEISPGDPTGGLHVDGGVTFGVSSEYADFVPLIGAGSGNYSWLTATGTVQLNGATLDIQSTDPSGACPALTLGTTYTLLSTTGSLMGSFANIDPGSTDDTLTMDCTGTQPVFTVAYDTSSSPETVTATVSGPVPTPPTQSPTTTTLSENETWTPDGPATLTATVTSSAGTPQGTVEFEESVSPFAGGGPVPISIIAAPNWTPISACAAVPLVQAAGTATAVCAFTNPPTGNYLQFRAVFVPSASSPFASSASGGQGAPIEGGPAGTSVGLGLVTNIKADHFFATLKCPTAGPCAVDVQLSVVETRRRGKVIAVSAATRELTVGQDQLNVAAGASKKITLTLNAAGRTLLKQFHHMKVNVSITSNGVPVMSGAFTFSSPSRSHKRTKR